MTPNELAVAEGRGEVVFELNLPGGGIHHHAFRVKRIAWEKGKPSEHRTFYLEFEEPGACGCVRRIDLSVMTHAALNMTLAEIAAAEHREVCADCGHNHHVDDAGRAGR